MIRLANERVVEHFVVELMVGNDRAIRLYEKYGFRKIGQFQGFLKIAGREVDCDLMNLYLADTDR